MRVYNKNELLALYPDYTAQTFIADIEKETSTVATHNQEIGVTNNGEVTAVEDKDVQKRNYS